MAAGAVGVFDLRLPMLLAGAGYVALAAALVALMREPHFTPAAADQRLMAGTPSGAWATGGRAGACLNPRCSSRMRWTSRIASGEFCTP